MNLNINLESLRLSVDVNSVATTLPTVEIPLGTDMTVSAVRGFIRPPVLENLDTENMTFLETAHNNSEYYYQALAAPGNVIHNESGNSENKRED